MPGSLVFIMEYKDKLVTNRPELFGVVIKTIDGPALVTTDGQIIVGTKQDMEKLFGALVDSLVPISPLTSVPLKNIRVHVEDFFKE